eukprot:IDg5357t1
MSVFGLDSPEEFLPISAELALASASYIVLPLKPTSKSNFRISLTYSVFKLLAICSLFASNLTLWNFMRTPLLLGLLLNEVVLLVASIRNKQQLDSICIRSMYTKLILACTPTSVFKLIANMFTPQLRGLAFAIAMTASVASISGWQYMLMGFK